jgi:hypothetical protein
MEQEISRHQPRDGEARFLAVGGGREHVWKIRRGAVLAKENFEV